MDWKSLFFGFDGRIGRKTWWLASIFLVSSGMVLTLLVNPRSWMGAPPNVADTLVSLAMIIPETAISVKRFNDRGWPQWMPYGLASMGMPIGDLIVTGASGAASWAARQSCATRSGSAIKQAPKRPD